VPAEAQRNARRVIARQVRSLARLIDDLLDVSRITRNKIQLRKATVRLQTAVENAVQTCRPLAQPRNQQLEVSMPSEAVFVDGDPTRLEQVLVNLLGNAAKYSGDGSTVQVVLASGQGKAQIRVKDNGVGIAPDVLPRVFDLFTQADASLERSQGGLGVGLTLVKRLVELHDGAVEAHSGGLGKGAEFVVSLPLLPAQPASTPVEKQIEPPRESSTPLRILVVDDNIDAAHSLQLLLELSGHHVSTVHSGWETLEAARAHKPDAILLDIALPGLNGYQVAERLRATPDTQNIVLVATTGYGQDEDRARAAQSGFDHHLVKPIDPDVLAGLLTAIAVHIKVSGNAGS
jgi:two-component system CheB/CheR fusion protein